MKTFTLTTICFLALLPIGSAGVTNVLLENADDAGSGGDAPEDHARAVAIETNTHYAGAIQHIWLTPDVLFWDARDAYAFQAEAGDVIDARVKGAVTTATIFAPDGSSLAQDSSVATRENFGLDAGAPMTGTYILEIGGFAPEPYCFAVGLNERAPMRNVPVPECVA